MRAVVTAAAWRIVPALRVAARIAVVAATLGLSALAGHRFADSPPARMADPDARVATR